ncbi:MAG: hypothetical protein Q4P23_11215 [Micrococcaceae bacterium]|nr:hypothetical protein [Micrococcaceae bacterium]
MFSAGHAHAGALVILGLVVLLLMDSSSVPAPWNLASDAALISAILIPAGFFLSAIGHHPVEPNRFIVPLWIGFGVLFLGLDVGGTGLISSSMNRHWFSRGILGLEHHAICGMGRVARRRSGVACWPNRPEPLISNTVPLMMV